MSNFGIFCPPLPGHLHPTAVLGRALRSRGHRVTVFQFEQFRSQVEAEELDFCTLGPDVSLASRVLEMGKAKGIQSLRLAIEGARQSADNICLYGPDRLRDYSIDVVLADQNEPAAGTVAEHLGIPFISLCPSLPLNREPAIPPPFVGWRYSRSPFALLRNTVGLRAADLLIAPINRLLNRYRSKWNLPLVRTPDDSFSKTAQLSQMTRQFDFPRHRLPDNFHYLGPWLDSTSRNKVSFPFDRLGSRPMVYASFGTLQPNAFGQFAMIAEACQRLDLQLVVAAGAAATQLGDLPGNPIIVPYAPQLQLLPKATLVVTHGGMNTLMQALSFGKPMVALPQTHDQPAIAARLACCGAGLVLGQTRVSAAAIHVALAELLLNSRYKEAAVKIQREIEESGGAPNGVRIIEQASR